MSSNELKNIEVSMSNLKAWVETGLRSMKEIQDKQDVELLTFAIAPLGQTIQDWEAGKVIPIQLVLKETPTKKKITLIPNKKGVNKQEANGT